MTNNITYLGVTLTKQVKDLCDKNFKSLKKEIEDIIFKQMVLAKLESACRRMQINPFLSPCTKLNSKWIKELHIKPDTLKLIEEKVWKSLKHMGTGEKIPAQNTNGFCCKIKNWQMGPHTIAKLL